MGVTGNKSYKWANATTGIQGQIVKVSADDTLDIANGSTAVCRGVLANQPKQNETAMLQIPQDGELVLCLVDGSGTAIAAGDPIKANATGRGVKAAKAGTFTAAANYIIGFAEEGATEADVLITIKLQPQEFNL